LISLNEIMSYLKNYDGEPISIMEVCGTHTSSIAKLGIKSVISDKIKLVSGPGCPVCVTVSEYIDRLCELSKSENNVIVSFGDMLRVKGSAESLEDAKASGGDVQMVYSPFEVLKLADENKDKTYIFAAVGFETTTPIYAMLIEKVIEQKITNIKILTSLKTMPNPIEWICEKNSNVSGFIAPGHVSVITGSEIFEGIANEYNVPFVVAGFSSEQILCAIYSLIKLRNQGKVLNLYKSAVNTNPNENSKALVEKYFYPYDASWRGIGNIPLSGLYLKDEFLEYDAGSVGLVQDNHFNPLCKCSEILIGKASPSDCQLFKKVCTPQNPQGACMVSVEGACHNF